MTTIADLFARAVQQHQAGQLADAAHLYRQILQQQPNHSGALNLLGVVACQGGDLPQGITYYRRALAAQPDLVGAHQNLALALQMTGQVEQAIAQYRTAIAIEPTNPELHASLGSLLVHQGAIEASVGHYRQALAVQPNNPTARLNLGAVLANLGQVEEAIAHLQQAIALQPNLAQAYFYLGQVLSGQGRLEQAESVLRQGLQLQPTPDLHYSLGKTLEEQGRVEEAIAQFDAALQLNSNFAAARWQRHLILPVLYDSPDQITLYRQRFCRELNHLIQHTDLNTPVGRQAALQGIGSRTNFYLAYQGCNDRGLQCKYGQFVHQVMTEGKRQKAEGKRQKLNRHPIPPSPHPPIPPSPHPPTPRLRKIRIGYLSAHLMAHSAAAWARGWMASHDRSRFEVYSYHIGRRVDGVTQEFRQLSDLFRFIPGSVEAIAQQVRADQLDVLVLTDIGMDPQTTQLAGLRLAPVQCTAWGHPVTSGIPTIDYYLSSQLMEPDNAQQHYSETLVLLPNIGICYPKPPLPERQLTRSQLGLPEGRLLYLCFQSPFKYLPQYDHLFAQIAQRVPQAQFVFLRHNSSHIVDRFQRRLQQAFAGVGLTSSEYCTFLPKLDRGSYWSLNQVCDVFLDSWEWSGGNSTLEAVAYGLPVVTCPGQFMRGRHSYAILTRLGVTETIAQSPAEYVDIAVRLAQDADWRQTIRQKIYAGHDQLYNDKTCVHALEEFFIQVVDSFHRNRRKTNRLTAVDPQSNIRAADLEVGRHPPGDDPIQD
jgi:predicted O-linked N-acetylglucosamine transferase (SPINDLY family)